MSRYFNIPLLTGSPSTRRLDLGVQNAPLETAQNAYLDSVQIGIFFKFIVFGIYKIKPLIKQRFARVPKQVGFYIRFVKCLIFSDIQKRNAQKINIFSTVL